MKVLYPPLGYKFANPDHEENGLPLNDEAAVLEFCLSLVEDEEVKKRIAKDTHEDRVKALISMGFEEDVNGE